MKKALNCVNHLSQNAPARSKLKSFYFWGRDLKTHLLSCSIFLKILFSSFYSKLLLSISRTNWDKETGEWFIVGLSFSAYFIILQNNKNLNRTKCRPQYTVHTWDTFASQAGFDNCQSL